LNIALFVPWGAILYLYRRNDNKSKAIIMTTLLGFSCSAFVEVTQRITGTGFFELTDIFTNTVGAFIGAALSAGLYTGYRGLKNKNEEQ
ncbi:MAG: VanZ family protein, partial [Butyrivibrio sp.]|nr:VanZ family protein [Butyrivibrio sp.]